MTTPKTPEALKEEALNVLTYWRSADRKAVSVKTDAAKRMEYRLRKHLRTAADNLTGGKHG